MSLIVRRRVLQGALAVSAAAVCGSGHAAPITTDDVVYGVAYAPVTLIEYASCTCPICARFHAEVWAPLKANYIDTGKVRFIYRELPAHAPAVAVAGFQIARCGGASPAQYMVRLQELYRQQEAIFASGTAEGIRAELVRIGVSAGLTAQQANACIDDGAGAQRAARIFESARQLNITGTPTLILNGRRVDDHSYAGLSRAIDAALAG